ncbi:MAG TPA: glycosyltransferase [Candidatus Avirikenella pullistercoris]|nr:glycosyltransferase [Candidatus Avirikenella pullistercoris]
MIKPKISIITVVYNAKEELRATLQSLLELKYSNLEIVVVDGGSTDGTRQVIEEYSVNIAHWVSEKDGGIYDAMNKGLRMATGDYVWFINAGDSVYDPYVLESIFKGQEHYADVYYGDTLILDTDGTPLGLRRKRLPKRLTWHSLRRGMVVCHQSVIVKREIAPPYNLEYKYAADIEWVIEVLKKASEIQNTHSILSKFVKGGTSSVHRRESLQERYRIMKKYYGTSRTVLSHIRFVFELLFGRPYRKLR